MINTKKLTDVKAIGSSSVDLGAVVLGMIGANQVQKMADKPMISVILLAGGILLNVAGEKSFIKNIGLGVGAYGAVKTLNKVANGEIMGTVMPSFVKDNLAKFVPSLSGVGDLNMDEIRRAVEAQNLDPLKVISGSSIRRPQIS